MKLHRHDDIDNVAQTIAFVNGLIRECNEAGDTAPVTTMAARLEWTEQEVSWFLENYRALLNYDSQLWQGAPPTTTLPPSEADVMLSDLSTVPTADQVAQAVELSDTKLRQGLMKMGLSKEEAQEWEACQQFNNAHFRESMDMISATVSRSQLMLAQELRAIRDRLRFVRQQIQDMGEFSSDERSAWVREERQLLLQFVEVGNLMRGNQSTWFQGSAQLALIRMRYGKGAGTEPTSRSKKPKFRPNQTSVIDTPP